jgi:hypothetical protein
MFAELGAGITPAGLPRSPATLQRIRATLRAAYNAAIREGMITDNPDRRVEIPAGRRPQAVVWPAHRHRAARPFAPSTLTPGRPQFLLVDHAGSSAPQ